MEKLVLIGTGLTAAYLYEFVNHYELYEVIGFAVNEQYRKSDKYLNLPVYALEDLKGQLPGVDFKVFVSVMWNNLNTDRRKIFKCCEQQGLDMVSLVAPTAVCVKSQIGKNCYIGDYSILSAGTIVGDDCYIMGGNILGEWSRIEKHSFMAFGSVVAGGVRVGEQCFLGMHSTVNEFVTIGEKCIVGSGVTVKYDLEPYTKISIANESYKIKKYDPQTIESKLVAKRK